MGREAYRVASVADLGGCLADPNDKFGTYVKDTNNDDSSDMPLPDVDLELFVKLTGAEIGTNLPDSNSMFTVIVPPDKYKLEATNMDEYDDVSDSDGDRNYDPNKSVIDGNLDGGRELGQVVC